MVRMTAAERDKLNAAAEAAGYSLQNYARFLIGLSIPSKSSRRHQKGFAHHGQQTEADHVNAASAGGN